MFAKKTRNFAVGVDYATLPTGERHQGDLAGVPQVYVHLTCRTATRMPEEIIRIGQRHVLLRVPQARPLARVRVGRDEGKRANVHGPASRKRTAMKLASSRLYSR